MIQVPQSKQLPVSSRRVRVDGVQLVAALTVKRPLALEPALLVAQPLFGRGPAVEVTTVEVAGFEGGVDLFQEVEE